MRRPARRTLLYSALAFAGVTSLVTVAGVAWSRGRLANDEILAGSLCLGTPFVFLAIAGAFGLLTGRNARRGEEGYCPRCGEWLRAVDLFCPQCGSSAAAWAVPPRMKSDRAREVSAERPVGRRRRQHVSVQLATEATLAAQYVVAQSQAPADLMSENAADCLADAHVARRLYHAAARRLHPDHNGGVQSDEWNRLQEAMEILHEHHANSEL